MTRDGLRATSRVARLEVVAGAAALGLVLLAVLSLVDRPVAPLLVLVGLVVTAPTGYLLDDPAADVLACSPTTKGQRRAARVALGLPVVIIGWLLVLDRARFLEGYDDLDLAATTVEVAAFAAVAVAIAAVLAQRGDHTPGLTAAVGTVVSVAVLFVAVTALPSSWPLPAVMPGAHASRWRWVLAGAVSVVLWTSRDPLARGLLRAPVHAPAATAAPAPVRAPAARTLNS